MPPRKKSPPPFKNKKEEIAHYNGILIENLRDEFRMVIEHVDSVKEQLIQRMDERFAKQDQRFDVIEAVLRHHSRLLEANEERWKQNDERWKQTDERWKQNDERWKQTDERWKQTDKRLERIEGKLDQVIEKVERHDQEIGEIKTLVSVAH